MRELKDTERDLQHWRNHFKDKTKYNVTKSLEGRYKPEGISSDDIPHITEPVDVHIAVKIEKIIITLPHTHKMIIVAQFMYPYVLNDTLFFKFCRKAAIKPRDYDELLRKAILMVHNKLSMIEAFK